MQCELSPKQSILLWDLGQIAERVRKRKEWGMGWREPELRHREYNKEEARQRRKEKLGGRDDRDREKEKISETGKGKERHTESQTSGGAENEK